MKAKGFLGMALAMALMSKSTLRGHDEKPVEYRPKDRDFEPKPQKGQFYYWFRIDGTFLSEKQGERMLRDNCVFICFAINDKNAIKKFNPFMLSNQIKSKP